MRFNTIKRHTANLMVNHERLIVISVAILFLALLTWRALSTPFDNFGAFDGRTYHQLGARAAASEHLFGKENFNHAYWSPGWVTVIATTYRLFGVKPALPRLLLVLCTVATGLLVYHWARRSVDPGAALIAMLLTLGSTLVFRFVAYHHYELMLGLLLLLSGWLLFGRTPRGAARDILAVLGAGVLLGFGILSASKAAVLWPLFVLVALIARRHHALRHAALLLIGILLITVPWTIRNYRCWGEFIPLTTNGGINLYIANNPHSTGGYYLPPSDQRPPYAHHDSKAWTKVAVDFIKANPGLTLKRTLAKAAVFWNPHYGDQFVMIILFFAGVFRFFRRRPPREWMRDAVGLWIIGVPLAFMTIHSVFHTEFRYILPVWPYLGLVAAHGLAGWRREIVGEPVPSENSIRRESG